MSQAKFDRSQIDDSQQEPNATNRNKLVALSAAMTGLAGAIHLWIIPEHWEHSRAHALFFLLVGIAQIVWSVAVWRKPSTRLYYIGAGMAGWLIVLYGITRWLPAPFGHGPEEIDMIGIVTKLFEGLGMIALVILIFQDLNFRAGRLLARKAIALTLLISFIAGFLTYGVALAAEPIFSGLSAPEEEHHHNNSAPNIMEPIELLITGKQSFHSAVIDPPPPAAAIPLTDFNGQPFQLSSLRGKVVLLYFGYTNCPNACPLTMGHLKVALELLGSRARDVQVVMVTTDPARDTPEAMKQFLGNFNPRFLGLLGTPDDLANIWKDYGVTVSDNSETHSSLTYVIDQNGNLQLTFWPDTSPEDIASDLKILLAEK